MHAERRGPRNVAMRRFFQEQWGHIQQLSREWLRQRSDTRKETQKVLDTVESFVNDTDARIRCVSAYKKKLRIGVRSLLRHVEAIVESLPVAVAVNRKAYAADPLVNAIFANTQEIRRIFSHARELNRYFLSEPSRGLKEAYAVLIVTKMEKNTFGFGLQGNIVVRDMPQTTLSFTDHELLAPCATENQVREALTHTLLTNVAAYLRVSAPRLILRTARNTQNDKLLCCGLNFKNPATYVEELTATLSRPGELLTLRRRRLRISRLGVIEPRNGVGAVNDIVLNEIKVGDFPTRIYALVRYPKVEMLPSCWNL